MDVQALWAEIVELVNTSGDTSYERNPNHYVEFYDKMRDLSDWLSIGGFPPVVDLPDETVDDRVSIYAHDCELSGESFRIVPEYSKDTGCFLGYFFITYKYNGEFKFARQLG